MGDEITTLAPPEKAPEHRGGRQSSQQNPNPLLGVSQPLGNQAMLRLLESGATQAKLRLSQPGEPDEIEADRVAERVVSAQAAPAIQRKCACDGGAPCAKCAEEEESIHRSVAGTIHRQSRPSIQRQAAGQTPAPGVGTKDSSAEQSAGREKNAPSLIVEDEAGAAAPGQMKKSQFMLQLRASVCATADAALAAVGRNSKSCPYIEQWLSFYSSQGADRIERALHKYAPETARAKSAQDYISIVSDRVRQAVTVWAKTGRVTGLPGGAPFLPGASRESVEAPPGAAPAGAGKEPAGGPASGPGQNILAKSEDSGAAATGADPRAVRERLGPGRPLDPGVRSRMEPAFGHDFSRVRLHTDSTAAQLSTELKARAFTIGESVAFGSGEYKPGTPIGEALIAHELAHVVQQGGAEAAALSRGMEQDRGLEEDADNSAVHAVASIFTRGKASLGRMASRVAPALKSGLQLQRCGAVYCPPGYCWTAVAAEAGLTSCTCHWKCLKIPPSEVSLESSTPPAWVTVPMDTRHTFFEAMGATSDPLSAGCICNRLEQDRGSVCYSSAVMEPTSDVRILGGAVAEAAKGRGGVQSHPSERAPTEIVGPRIAGEGKTGEGLKGPEQGEGSSSKGAGGAGQSPKTEREIPSLKGAPAANAPIDQDVHLTTGPLEPMKTPGEPSKSRAEVQPPPASGPVIAEQQRGAEPVPEKKPKEPEKKPAEEKKEPEKEPTEKPAEKEPEKPQQEGTSQLPTVPVDDTQINHVQQMEAENQRLSNEAKAADPAVKQAKANLDQANKRVSDLSNEVKATERYRDPNLRNKQTLETEIKRAESILKDFKNAQRKQRDAQKEYDRLAGEQSARYEKIRSNKAAIERIARPELALKPTLRGVANELRVLKEEGLVGIKRQFTLKDPKTGEWATTIPDGMRPSGATVDVKDVIELSETQQLRLQREISRHAGQKAEIITGTKTKVPAEMEQNYNIRRRPDLGPR